MQFKNLFFAGLLLALTLPLQVLGDHGRISYYVDAPTYNNPGSCGREYVYDYYIALNDEQLDGNKSYYCGKCVKIVYNNKYLVGRISDRCPGCPSHGLDVSPQMMDFFVGSANRSSVGVVQADWSIVSCDEYGKKGECSSSGCGGNSSPKTTTTKKTTTTTTTKKTTTTTIQKPTTTTHKIIITTTIQKPTTTTHKIIITTTTHVPPSPQKQTSAVSSSSKSSQKQPQNQSQNQPSNASPNPSPNPSSNPSSNPSPNPSSSQPSVAQTTLSENIPTETQAAEEPEDEVPVTVDATPVVSKDSPIEIKPVIDTDRSTPKEINDDKKEGGNPANYIVPATGAVIGAAGIGLLYLKRENKYENISSQIKSITRSITTRGSSIGRSVTRSLKIKKRPTSPTLPTSNIGSGVIDITQPARVMY